MQELNKINFYNNINEEEEANLLNQIKKFGQEVYMHNEISFLIEFFFFYNLNEKIFHKNKRQKFPQLFIFS
jgi:hypothetical protein